MKICIARLRSNVRYQGPRQTVLDSFFENYVRWMNDNPQHSFRTYNCSFDGTRPTRTVENIEWADVIVIPSDSEFRYHDEVNQLNPKDLAKSWDHIAAIKPFFRDKTVVMFRSDRADTEHLYRSFLPDIKRFITVDEMDFGGNIHGMKYHFLQTLHRQETVTSAASKSVDFAYWGRSKRGDDRNKILRKVHRSDLSTTFVGSFATGIERQSKWISDWSKLYPVIKSARATLCFNWIDSSATTARYPEAIAIGMIPFVWGDYDSNDTLNTLSWQRVKTFEEFDERLRQIRDRSEFLKYFEEIRDRYLDILISEDDYYDRFANLMTSSLECSDGYK